jgi:hypothetical protein
MIIGFDDPAAARLLIGSRFARWPQDLVLELVWKLEVGNALELGAWSLGFDTPPDDQPRVPSS